MPRATPSPTGTSLPHRLAPSSPPVETPTPTVRRLSAGLAGTFRSLRHRNYRLYFFGQLISLTGSWVQTTALMWLVYELTQQSMWAALIAAAQVLPTFLLGAWGGALADRWPKRHLIFLTQAAFLFCALLLAGLVLAGVATPMQMLIITAATGLINAVDLPARLAFVMDLVGRDDVLNAVALNSLLFNLARVLGPLVAGGLLLWLGPGYCFLVNGLSYVAVLWALARMDVPGSVHPAGARREPLAVLGGFGYLAARPRLALLMLLSALIAMFGWPSLALLPALARHALGVQESGYSLLLSGMGCGALAAALAVAAFGTMARRRLFIILGVMVTAAGLLGLGVVKSLSPAVFSCGLLGFGLILFFATSQAMVHLSAADHNRGRILGIWSMVMSGALPLGNLLSGPAADRWGEPVVLVCQGAGCALAAVALVVLGVSSRAAAAAPAIEALSVAPPEPMQTA